MGVLGKTNAKSVKRTEINEKQTEFWSLRRVVKADSHVSGNRIRPNRK